MANKAMDISVIASAKRNPVIPVGVGAWLENFTAIAADTPE